MRVRVAAAGAVALLLAGCATVPRMPADGPATAGPIVVVARGWHSDVCLRAEDADARVLTMARDFAGARFLCFGFGERQYVVARDHSLLTMASALLPSRGALLLTALRDPPAVAFGTGNVTSLGVSRGGLAGLLAFLRHSSETDTAGQPVRFGVGPYPGSAFFGATDTYAGFYTCNTWTADALRAARLPVDGGVLFAGGVMRQARRIAAAQGGGS
jgi:hypothetical protein